MNKDHMATHRLSFQENAVAKVTIAPADWATQRPLFVGKGADGHQYVFVVLDDGRCALTRDGKVMQAWSHDDLGIDTAVDQFCALTGVAGLAPVSERARAFAVQPRSRAIKGRGHVKQR